MFKYKNFMGMLETNLEIAGVGLVVLIIGTNYKGQTRS